MEALLFNNILIKTLFQNFQVWKLFLSMWFSYTTNWKCIVMMVFQRIERNNRSNQI